MFQAGSRLGRGSKKFPEVGNVDDWPEGPDGHFREVVIDDLSLQYPRSER